MSNDKDSTEKRGKAPKVNDEARAKGYVTAEEIAKLLTLSPQRIRQLRNEGAMVTEDTEVGKRYHLVKSLLALSKYLLAKQDRASVKERAAKADADYKERKAALIDIELQKRRSEVHEARHVKELMNGMIIETKAAFLAVPGRIAVSLMHCRNESEMAETVRNALCEVMEDMSHRAYDPDKYKQMVDEDGDIIALEEDEEEEA